MGVAVEVTFELTLRLSTCRPHTTTLSRSAYQSCHTSLSTQPLGRQLRLPLSPLVLCSRASSARSARPPASPCELVNGRTSSLA